MAVAAVGGCSWTWYCHTVFRFTYSSVPNRCACTFINFEKKNPPCTVLFGSARLLFLRENSPCTFIFLHFYCYLPCTFINFEKKIPPARPYLGLHVWCFLRIFPPARLFCPKRLFGTLEYLQVWAIFVITIKICYDLPKLLLEFMPFDLAWNTTTDVFDQIPHPCHFVLHIAVNTNVSEGFVFTAIWSTYMEGRPTDSFVPYCCKILGL